MRWILSIFVCLALAAAARAAGPDDDFVDIFNTILQAQNLEKTSQTNAAAIRYRDALTSLQRLKADHPDWNPDVVNFRLEFLQDKVSELGKYLPPMTAANAAPAPASAAPANGQPAAAPNDATAALRAQIEALTAANTQLQQKLKEALSVQPAASPEDLAKAQAKAAALEKENELLNVTLQQEKAAAAAKHPEAAKVSMEATNAAELAKARSELTQAKKQIGALNGNVTDLRRKLDEASDQITALKATPPQPAPPAQPSEDAQKLMVERDELKAELAQRTRDLAEAEAHAAEPKPPPSAAPAEDTAKLTEEVAQLKDRLAVLEASPVPYTPEELAILNAPPAKSPAASAPVATAGPATTASEPAGAPVSPPPVSAPAAVPPSAPAPHAVAHTYKDLPPGVGGTMAEAARDLQDRDYKGAEDKYKEVLSQDENNVYVLAHLASVQFQAGEYNECEKSVDRAVSLDPNDPASLYLLGILRYRQERLDDALDALSRSAQSNPTNSGTQNYLGCVLADKGQRPAAETAFRKALELDPDYADAHYNLAFVYATEKPPSLALARWHYKRATDLGHPRNGQLEKILDSAK